MKQHTKIHASIPGGVDGFSEVESMWAKPIEGQLFEVDNIPFYASGIALYDKVSVRNVDGLLYIDSLVHPSGHSTIQLWFADENAVAHTRRELKALGCNSEISDQPRLIAFDVPPTVDYSRIKTLLEAGAEAGKWDYQEACLGFR